MISLWSNEFNIPLSLLKDEAILGRLIAQHPERWKVEKSVGQLRGGFIGEKRIRYYINLLNENHLRVLHAIRLPGSNSAFQMDYLLITEKVIIILEVKYLSGTIYVGDPLQQCIRVKENGEKERLKDPLSQVQHQRLQLVRWLQTYFPTSIPVDYLIVNTHPNGIIKVEDPNSEYVEKFFAEERFPQKYYELTSSYSKPILAVEQIHKLVNLLKHRNTELDSNPLNPYDIEPHELLRGIKCPLCQKLSVNKVKRKWMCSLCESSSFHYHKQAIKDYFLIFNQPISNQACKDWLSIESRDVVKRILTGMDLKAIGRSHQTRYYPRDMSFFRS